MRRMLELQIRKFSGWGKVLGDGGSELPLLTRLVLPGWEPRRADSAFSCGRLSGRAGFWPGAPRTLAPGEAPSGSQVPAHLRPRRSPSTVVGLPSLGYGGRWTHEGRRVDRKGLRWTLDAA